MGRVVCASGAREIEDLLLGEIDADQARVADDPALLGLPFLIVVPSRSLRDHLAARITAHRGSALGLVIQTHLQTAYRLTEERVDPLSLDHDPILAVLVRRAAAADPRLHQVLDDLVQGYRSVVDSVDDLLHAEFSEELLETLQEAIAELDSPVAAERAGAVAEVAALSLRELGRHALMTRDMLIEEAGSAFREALRSAGGEAVLARAIRIHGFADATGVVTTFLEELLKHPDSALLLDRPADPARPGRLDSGIAFSRPFGLALGEAQALPEASPRSPRIEYFTAPGGAAEAREIARRVRALLDDESGPPPEEIGVVARTLEPHLFALGEALDAYGVPWQAPGSRGAIDPPGRLLLGLRRLLGERARCPLDAWMEALEPQQRTRLWKARLAAATLGAGRLQQVDTLPLDRLFGRHQQWPLGLRQGFVTETDEDGETITRLRRESVSREVMVAFQEMAHELLKELERWADSGRRAMDLDEHLRRLRQLVEGPLAWSTTPAGGAALQRLDEILQDLAAPVELSFEEFLFLLGDPLSSQARPAMEDGGGIRLLGVTEARAWTFQRLFIIGLNRGSFPPTFREDPLLPDRVRARLRSVLPQLKSKRERSEEERFLFAQLVGSSPHVTLSWWSTDEDGKTLPPSPFVQRLRMNEEDEAMAAAGILDPFTEPPGGPRPLSEHLMEAALRSDGEGFEKLLAPTLEEATPPSLHARWPHRWPAAARRVLEEWDRPAHRASDLGPWLGGLGTPPPPLVKGPLWVTRLESAAQCPWSEFLEKTLGLEALPDPLGELPTLDPRRVGSVVHKTLETLVRRVTGPPPTLSELAGGSEEIDVPWPGAEQLRRLSEEAARQVLLEEGLVLDGLARALAVRARPYLEVVRRILFTNGSLKALGAEIQGAAELELDGSRRRRVHFRADLVHRSEGALALVDFKTGRPFVETGGKSREGKLRKALASGEHLQGMVYAVGAPDLGEEGAAARGIYLFLDPDTPDGLRTIEYRQDDTAMEKLLVRVVGLLDRARHLGLLFPRLTDPSGRDESSRCRYCTVATACVHGDSQSRRRERDYFAGLQDRRDEEQPLDAVEHELLRLWELPRGEEGKS